MQHDSNNPPRLRKITARALSPARKSLVDAAIKARFSLRDLSLKIGKNPSYLQNYLVKGSPRHLPEQQRHELARLLQVSHVTLTDEPVPPHLTAMKEVAYEEPVSVLTWVEGHEPEQKPFDNSLPSASLVLRLSRPHGLFQPRHVIICDEQANPSAGDLVAVMSGNDLAAIGLLLPGRSTEISVLEGSDYMSFLAAAHRMFRITAILDR